VDYIMGNIDKAKVRKKVLENIEHLEQVLGF
jgi:hypothetical protein